MTPITARVKANYSNGAPAITEHQYGKGQAVLIGLDASRRCFEPGHETTERLIVEHTLGRHRSPYSCEGALVYRLSSPAADHYYFINDGPARTVSFESEFQYKSAIDALSGEEVNLQALHLHADDGRWVRMER
jgi:beta-galactosidase